MATVPITESQSGFAEISRILAGMSKVFHFLSSYSSPYSLIAISLIRNFWAFPSKVIGNSLTNLMYRGRFEAGRFARQ